MKRIGIARLEEESKYLRLLVYGQPGSGKTWLCASASLHETTRPVLYLDYRGQITSLRGSLEYRTAIEEGQLFISRLGQYSELNHFYTWLVGNDVPALDKAWPHDCRPRTLVLDSLTELQRLEVLRRAGNLPEEFKQDLERPTIRDWGTLLDQFVLLARLFFDLPMHVVFTALERVDFNEQDQVIGNKLAMHGQAAQQVPAYALTVMRLAAAPMGSKMFNIGYLQGGRTAAKDQTGAFPAKVSAPTIPGLVAALRKGGPSIES